MTQERIVTLRSGLLLPAQELIAECLDEIERLQVRLDFDIVERYQGDGTRYWASAGAWLMPGQALAVVSMP